jgi:hypothetical protein
VISYSGTWARYWKQSLESLDFFCHEVVKKFGNDWAVEDMPAAKPDRSSCTVV